MFRGKKMSDIKREFYKKFDYIKGTDVTTDADDDMPENVIHILTDRPEVVFKAKRLALKNRLRCDIHRMSDNIEDGYEIILIK